MGSGQWSAFTGSQARLPFWAAASMALILAVPQEACAAFQGVPGEALLIPFVLYDSKNRIDTVVHLTLPNQVGRASVPNLHTAPHTSPSESALPNTPVRAHWILLDVNGLPLADAMFEARPQQLHSLTLSDILKGIGRERLDDGKAGSLVILTQSGFEGREADFNLVANASMSFGTTDHLAAIPVFAMADGEDAAPLLPRPGNEVTSARFPIFRASPLAAGISTGTAGGEPPRAARFDLALHQQLRSGLRRFVVDNHTLLAIWNDRPYPSGSNVWSVTVRNDQGHECAGEIDVTRQLNLYWVSIEPQALATSPVGAFSSILLCNPSAPGRRAYVEVQVPPLVDTHAASVAFSVIVNREFFFGPHLATSLALERGMAALPR